MQRYLSTLLLGAALLAPIGLRADDDDHRNRDRDSHRYYDSSKRDWHEWNENEDRAYRRYLQDQKREYRDWNKASKRDQANYWKWRHQHPDRDDHDRR